jgi:hypothetical protein
MAITAAVAIGFTVTTGAIPALANQTGGFYVNNGSSDWFMFSNNVPNNPLQVNDGGGCACGTSFQNINGTKESILGANPQPVYEWEQGTTNRCWTYDASDDSYLIEDYCSAGDTDQLFWQTSSGQLVNVAAFNETGVSQCVNATHAENDADVNVIPCKSKSQPGGFDQYWYTQG